MEQIVVSGATLKKDLAQFALLGVPNQPGVAAEVFARLAEHNVVVDDIIQTIEESGKATTSFTVEHTDLSECKLVVNELRKQFSLRDVAINNVAKVSIVGVGMRSHAGVARKMFNALAAGQVNINAITTSEIKISCIIAPEDGVKALRAVHAAFDLDKEPAARPA